MEDPFEIYVSKALVEVNWEIEFTELALHFGWAANDVRDICFENTSTRIFPFSLDWWHEYKRLWIEHLNGLLSIGHLENAYSCIIELLWEWINRVLLIYWQTTSGLGQRNHALGILSWSTEELRVLGISLHDVLLLLVWKTTGVILGPLRLESHTSPIFWEVKIQK